MKYSASLLASALFGSFASTSLAKTLYVGTGVAQILSYSFDGTNFKAISSTNDSFPSPSWQTLSGSIMYSVSESSGTDPGAITAYAVKNGTFAKKSQVLGLAGPVHIAVTKNGAGVISAAYGAGGINTFTTDDCGNLQKNQQFKFNGSSIVTGRQDASHPHEIIIDPTGQFAVVPDLGADLLHVFLIKGSKTTNNLTPLTSVQANKGSGPRHGVFWPNSNGTKPTHFFIVAELNSEITAYKLDYGVETLTFHPETSVTYNTFGTKTAMPTGAAAGEISISPDNKFLYVSNRLDVSFPKIGSSGNGSDSMALWAINPNGTLNFVELAPAGGLNPRHFNFVTLSGKDYITVANPKSGDVQLIARDVATGKLAQNSTAFISIPGASVVTWD